MFGLARDSIVVGAVYRILTSIRRQSAFFCRFSSAPSGCHSDQKPAYVRVSSGHSSYFFGTILYPAGGAKRASSMADVSIDCTVLVIDIPPIRAMAAAIGPSPVIEIVISVS